MMSRITARHEKIVNALLSSKTVAEASRACGITERHIWRLLERKDFQNRYESARRRMTEGALNRLRTEMTAAVDALALVLTDQTAPHSAKVSAARTILEFGLKGFELQDLEKRIQQLEEKLGL